MLLELETKNGLAIIAALIALLAYLPYFRNIMRRKTRPHAFSWLVWGSMSTVAFFAQYGDGGGAGTWILAMAAICDLTIFFLALNRGETNINKVDWLCLSGAMIGMALFMLNSDPTSSVVLISSIYIIGFIPTIRKSVAKPRQETAVTYMFNSLKYVIAICALGNYTFVTLLYPSVVALMNGSFVIILLYYRSRKQLPSKRPRKGVAKQ